MVVCLCPLKLVQSTMCEHVRIYLLYLLLLVSVDKSNIKQHIFSYADLGLGQKKRGATRWIHNTLPIHELTWRITIHHSSRNLALTLLDDSPDDSPDSIKDFQVLNKSDCGKVNLSYLLSNMTMACLKTSGTKDIPHCSPCSENGINGVVLKIQRAEFFPSIKPY